MAWSQSRWPRRGSHSCWPKELQEEWKVTVGIGHATPVVVRDRIYVLPARARKKY